MFIAHTTDTGGRKAFADQLPVGPAHRVWRVRAVNGAGYAGPWSEPLFENDLTFQEP